MTLSDDWDFSDLEEIPFTGTVELKPVAAAVRLCGGCGCPLPNGHEFVYCGKPKSDAYNRCKQKAYRVRRSGNAGNVTSELQKQLQQLQREIAELRAGRGSSVAVAAASPSLANAGRSVADPDLDFDIEIEVKKDETAGARSSENLRRTLMAMYNGEGVWAAAPKVAKSGSRL